MVRVRLAPLLAVPTIFIVGLIASGSVSDIVPEMADRKQPAPAPLLYVEHTSADSRVVQVTGNDFPPGEGIYLALYDGEGRGLHAFRWIEDGAQFSGPSGGQDPAHGFPQDGSFREAFAVPCGEAVLVRAYMPGSGIWSNNLLVPRRC